MKPLLNITLCILLCAMLVGCAMFTPTDDLLTALPAATEPDPVVSVDLPKHYTFPSGTYLHGTNIGGMTIPDAYKALCHNIADYRLTATVNHKVFSFSGTTLELTCSEGALLSYATALHAGLDTGSLSVITFNESLLSQRLSSGLNTEAKNADIFYNTHTGLFELIPGADGKHVDMDAVMDQIRSAVNALRQDVNIRTAYFVDKPAISENSHQAQTALEKANEYLSTRISYRFTYTDDIALVTLPAERIAEMIGFDCDLNPYIIPSRLRSYVDEINKEYGQIGLDGTFITTAGTETELPVTYYAQYLDVDMIYEDILFYLEKGISGTRLPPHLDELTPQQMPFKGSYIEVDLTNQTLYLYQDTQCILKTPIVTGCVASYMNTPTGVYEVLVRAMHVTLIGEDYETYVKYWMQFHGGYGLHDAYWRYRFGGNEYLYNGSHGCVNIPPENAAFVYENISSGYPVILYGGATNKEPLQQQILGADCYDTTIYTQPFQLDAKLAQGTGNLTYTSANPAVASVAEDGTVTVHKTGSTVIQVEFEESRYYTGASLQVTVNVDGPCTGKHSYGPWYVTTMATCAQGEQTRTCKDCGKPETMATPANSDHSYGDWAQTVAPDCIEGQECRICTVCGSEEYQSIPAEHDLRDWYVREEPTCETPGENFRDCRNCDYEETEILPALGHSFSPEEEFCGACETPNPEWIAPTDPEE